MRVSILKHIEFENPGYYIEYFAQRGFEVLVHNLFEGEKPDENADIILVLGGPMNIYEEDKYPFLSYEKKFLFEAFNKGKKVIGVCLGSQLIADVLGTKVYKNAHKEIGWFPINKSLSNKDEFLPDNISVFHWHGDTFDLPEGAIVLFHSEATKNQAFEYGSNVLAMQFHLEIDEAGIKELIRNCKDDLDGSLFVMTEKEIKDQWHKLSSMNKELLWNILDHFL